MAYCILNDKSILDIDDLGDKVTYFYACVVDFLSNVIEGARSHMRKRASDNYGK